MSYLKNSSKNMFFIAFFGLLIGISSTMVYSQLGMFLKHQLHATAAQIALFDGVVELIANITKVLAGTFSDFLANRKSILLFGCFLTFLARPFLCLFSSFTGVFTSMILDRISNGFQAAPRDALIGDIVPIHERGKAFGLSKSFKTAGAFLGTALAIFMLKLCPGNYNLVFIISGLFAILGFVFLCCVKVARNSTSTKVFQNPFDKESVRSLGGNFWLFILFVFLFELGHFSDILLSVRANDFSEAATASSAGLYMNFGQFFFAYPIGYFMDKFGERKLVYFCIMLMLLANVCFLFATNVYSVFVGAFLWGGQMSSIVTLFLPVVTRVVSSRLRGTGVGIYFLTVGLSYFIASLIAGKIWHHLGSSYVFCYSICICCFCLIFSKYVFRKLELCSS